MSSLIGNGFFGTPLFDGEKEHFHDSFGLVSFNTLFV